MFLTLDVGYFDYCVAIVFVLLCSSSLPLFSEFGNEPFRVVHCGSLGCLSLEGAHLK